MFLFLNLIEFENCEFCDVFFTVNRSLYWKPACPEQTNSLRNETIDDNATPEHKTKQMIQIIQIKMKVSLRGCNCPT